MPYGEIVAPCVMEGDKNGWVHPKRLRFFGQGEQRSSNPTESCRML